jgi:hypothetical protein
MTWVPLLLADRSPCLCYLVLRDLLNRPADDPEVQELREGRERDPLVSGLLGSQEADGAWGHGDPLWSGDRQRITLLALMRLGFLGFGADHPAVRRGAEYLFSLQREDGAWGAPRLQESDELQEGYSMIPLQTALPLRALAMCGLGADPRAERAYEWLLAQRLSDGAWPTGIAGGGTYGRVAGYRRLPHSRWGCRSNTTGALLALAYHPQHSQSEAARRALDLLLGRETQEASTLGFEVARIIGAERTQGFLTFYARFDLSLILSLAWRVGATLDDPRLAEQVSFVQSLHGEYGLWPYARPQAARWVTFDLLRSLAKIDAAGDWVSMEPRTPFQPYPRQAKRY